MSLPEDLQRIIFELAAHIDTRTARHLVLVASHVRKWIDPILYKSIVVRTQADAALLLATLPSKLTSHVKPTSLALGASVTFAQSKALLSLLSLHLSDFAVWGGPGRNPSIFLPFVKSGSAGAGSGGSHNAAAKLRRLALRSQHPCELNFPPSLLAGLTHLMILDGPYTWFQMREVARRHTHAKSQSMSSSHSTSSSTSSSTPSPPRPSPSSHGPQSHSNSEPEHPPPPPELFHSLTHFAVCTQNWGSTHALLRPAVAPHLTHFVVVVAPHKATGTIAQRIEELGDRRVVLVEHEMTVGSWRVGVGGAGAGADGEGEGLWERAERLVREGYFTEGGLGGEPRRWKPRS